MLEKARDQMNRYTYILQQFCPAADTIRPCLALTASVERRAGALFLQYHISGDMHVLHIPRGNGAAVRRNGLWRDSCFECFIGLKGHGRYWEINLSPNGDWNVYCFNDYRQGMTEETAFLSLPSTFYETKDDLWLDLIVDLSSLIREDHPLELGISCVMKHSNGDTSLWALHHSGQRADFHHRSGFIITL